MMRNFDWIFDKNGNVAKGKECVFDRAPWYWDDWDDPKPQVVTLAGYRPYYTDGTPDPKNDEVNEVCMIELNEYPDDDYQQQLYNLFEIEDADEDEKSLGAVYDGKLYEVRGKYTNNDDDEMYVLKSPDGEYAVVEKYEVDWYCSPHDLEPKELKTLFCQIKRGSCYLSDYDNTVGCTWSEASAFCEGYYEWLNEEYGENYEEHDDVKSWLSYAGF